MPRPDSQKPIASRHESPISLTDEDIKTVRVDRRSFLSRAVAVGSVAAGAALTTRCSGGTDSDSSDSGASTTDADGTDSGAQATDPDNTDSDSQ